MTPKQPQPEQTVAEILRKIRDAGALDDNKGGEDWRYSDQEIDNAKQALNRQALATALRLIGDDIEPPEINIAVIEGAIGFHVRRELNEYKAKLRQAFTDYYGGGE